MPPPSERAHDPLRIAISIGLYAAIFWAAQIAFFWVLSIFGTFGGVTLATLTAAIFANWLALRVYEDRPLWSIGLYAGTASARNGAIGVAGGMGAASLVLAAPLATGLAHLGHAPASPTAGTVPFAMLLLAAGSMGEEMLFHGYAFQVLLPRLGRWATVFLAGAIFALMHASNPHATWFGLVNTAGFGVLFGYAFLRSRDLWLPIGLHFGWNFTLPLLGVNLSGLRMNVTGHEMVWTAGKLWSGGDYGPEASLLTSGVLVLLFIYLRVAPIGRQTAPPGDPPAERVLCESSSPPL